MNQIKHPVCMCIVNNDGTTEFKPNLICAGTPHIFTVCGNGQAPRNYVTSWLWNEDGLDKNEVRIYVSEELDNDEMIKQLDHIFESVKYAYELIGRIEHLDPIIPH